MEGFSGKEIAFLVKPKYVKIACLIVIRMALCPVLWLAVLAISLSLGHCEEVAYVFREDSYSPLGHSNLAEYNGSDIVMFTVASIPDGNWPASTYFRTVNSIKNEIDEKIEVGNPVVRAKAATLAARYPGSYTINQICSIYDHMKVDWSYVNDPRGIEYFQYANETIQIGRAAGYNGAGDCDDFAILMSALMENIGGTTRIILAYGPNGGHAYTEVFLGNMNTTGYNNLERIIEWLIIEYSIEEINTHIDTSTNEVWLNLDWSVGHPGGPFYLADKQIPIYIGNTDKVSVKPPNLFDVSKMFDPSRGHDGDYIDILIDEYSRNEPHSGTTCMEINYTAAGSLGAGWAEIYWLFPKENRGTNPGWKNIFIGTTKLTFWARGNNGGEKAEFYMGGITGRYSDSVRPAISMGGVVTLSKDWQHYTIDLTNMDLSHVIGGFRVVIRAPQNPDGCTVYLDDIRYEIS